MTTTTTAHHGAPRQSRRGAGRTPGPDRHRPRARDHHDEHDPARVARHRHHRRHHRDRGLHRPEAQHCIRPQRPLHGPGVGFWTDGAGAASATLDLSSLAGRRIQVAMFAQPNDWFGPDYAVAAPFTPVTS